MADVFISYSHSDRFFAQLLEKELSNAGISCWRDSSGLKPGSAWRDDIDVAIATCKIVVLALSSVSVESKYVNYEWAFAMGMQRIVIPVLLEDCNRHAKVEPIQYIDFRTENTQNWRVLIERIREYRNDESVEFWEERCPISEADDNEGNELAQEIYDYISRKGFRIISKDRVRESIRTNATDENIDLAIKKDPRLRQATVFLKNSNNYKPAVAVL